ncbi:MAG: septum formation initiator family protein [Pseudomonadota bacterium]
MIVIGGLLLLFALSAQLWLSNDGMREVWRLNSAIAAQQAENDALRARNAALTAQVHDLKTGTDAIEESARQYLGMTRPNETFFQVVEQRQ